MNRIAEGESDVAPLKFRKKDMWDGLSDDFNNMVDALRNSRPKQEETIASDERTSSVREQDLVSV